MPSIIKRITAILLTLTIVGCAGTPVDPTDTRRSVVFGYIDMEDAPTSVDWVFIQHYDGTTDGYSVGAKDGLYYHVGIPPGPYQVTKFGGSGFFAGQVIYNFADSGRNDTALIIDRPGAYFAGSFEYQTVNTGFFEQKKFDITPAVDPTEAMVLEKVLRRMRKENPNYTHAISLAEKRLAELQ